MAVDSVILFSAELLLRAALGFRCEPHSSASVAVDKIRSEWHMETPLLNNVYFMLSGTPVRYLRFKTQSANAPLHPHKIIIVA